MLLKRKRFVAGPMANGIEHDLVGEILNTLLMFVDYDFNKSHAVAYSSLTC